MEGARSEESTRHHKSTNNGNGTNDQSLDNRPAAAGFESTNLHKNGESKDMNRKDEHEGSPSGGLLRSKPAREIYRPPNVRQGRRSHHGHGRNQNKYGKDQQQYWSNGYNSGPQSQSQEQFNRGPRPRPFNIYAKEFHFNPGNSQYFMPPRPLYNALIQQESQDGTSSYPITHSKSSGTMMSQFQEYAKSQPGPPTPGILASGSIKPDTVLQRNKSSGSIPVKHRVWFQEDQNGRHGETLNRQQAETLERQFSLMKLKGEKQIPAFHRNVPQPQVQKSRSGFYGRQLSETDMAKSQQQQQVKNELNNPGSPPYRVQRSKSFGWIGGKSKGDFSKGVLKPFCPSYSDFQLEIWPKNIQDAVVGAITGGDPVPARSRIEMVTLIFSALFGVENVSTQNTLELSDFDELMRTDPKELTTPAVQIFTFFIQKEKDSTVLESLLNTSFATYKSLFRGNCGEVFGSGNIQLTKLFDKSISSKWIVFLKFVSAIYSMAKSIGVGQGKSFEDLRLALLSLLCDSCLSILRATPELYTNDLMETLFMVLTSLGRDIELNFNQKMKQILTGIRDLLLGISPYSNQGSFLQPQAHKILMQLVELHAANWNLPASAVRYYYTQASGPGLDYKHGDTTLEG